MGGAHDLVGEAAEGDLVAVLEDHGALEDVLELADVAGPGVGVQGSGGVVGQGAVWLAVAVGEALQEALGEEEDVAFTLTEGRELDGEHRQAVVEVFAEASRVDILA